MKRRRTLLRVVPLALFVLTLLLSAKVAIHEASYSYALPFAILFGAATLCALSLTLLLTQWPRLEAPPSDTRVQFALELPQPHRSGEPLGWVPASFPARTRGISSGRHAAAGIVAVSCAIATAICFFVHSTHFGVVELYVEDAHPNEQWLLEQGRETRLLQSHDGHHFSAKIRKPGPTNIRLHSESTASDAGPLFDRTYELQEGSFGWIIAPKERNSSDVCFALSTVCYGACGEPPPATKLEARDDVYPMPQRVDYILSPAPAQVERRTRSERSELRHEVSAVSCASLAAADVPLTPP